MCKATKKAAILHENRPRKECSYFFGSREALLLAVSTLVPTALLTAPAPLFGEQKPVVTIPIAVRCEGDDANSTVVVSYPPYSRPKHTVDRTDVIVDFGADYKAEVFLEGTPCEHSLKAVRSGYSKFVLRFLEERVLSFDSGQASLRISAADTRDPSRAALADAKARVLFELGEKEDAIRVLNEELANDPANGLLLRSRGSYEAQTGDTHQALRTMTSLEATNPDTIDYGMLHQLKEPFTPAVGGSFESVDGGSAFEQQIYSFFGQAPVSQDTVPGMAYAGVEINHTSVEDLRDPTTGTLVNRSVNQERYTAEYRHPLERDDLAVGVKGNEDNFGAHVRLDVHGKDQGTTFRAQVNEPVWDYSSALIFNGTKHAVGAGHQVRMTPRLRIGGEVTQNFFAIDSASDAAKSLSVNANVGWLLATDPASLELVYALDADYFYDILERTSSAGERYKVFSVQTTEYHAVTLNAVKTLVPASKMTRALELYGVGGAAFDRLGDTAPLIGAGLRGGNAKGLSGQVEIGRTFTTVGNSDTQTRVLVSTLWRF